MRGTGPLGEHESNERAASRPPSIGVAPLDREPPSDTANEDFLFHLYRGSELLQDNRAHEAKEELEQALHLQPHDAKGQDLLGVVYFRLGLYPRAITIYEQLRRKSPRDPALLLNLALCYLKTGQPELARRDLEQLLTLSPQHARAWGYLGLACERLGDLAQAERAFQQGGHGQMARRMAERRASAVPPSDGARGSFASREVREVVAAAFEELDAGELSFALAEPISDSHEAVESWRPLEIGQRGQEQDGAAVSGRTPTQKPDTRDGPPPVVVPQIGAPSVGERRPTLIVGVPPAHEAEALSALEQVASVSVPRPPTFGATGASSTRAPKHTLPPPAPGEKETSAPARGPTASPPPVTAPPPAASELALRSAVVFPAAGNVSIHRSGVALVRTAAGAGFAARLEAIRAASNGLSTRLLERQVKGKPTGESFGGVGSPIAHATGDGQLMLAARPGRKLSSFVLDDGMCFVREEVLLGFDGELTFENGRLGTGEGELIAVVQLRGRGAVLLEAIGDVLTIDVQANRGVSVRREAILGWFGRLVPRALAASEAPCGQRGLVSFAGDGRVLVASG